MLQCTEFARTGTVARHEDDIVGFVSGFISPARGDPFFIRQVAVDAAIHRLEATVTPSNLASHRMFEALARDLAAPLTIAPGFARDAHFEGAQESEQPLNFGQFDKRKPHRD